MPAALIPIIAAVAGGAASYGVAAFVGGGILGAIIGGLAGAAVSFGVSAIGASIFRTGKAAPVENQLSARTQQVRQAITYHRGVVGRVRTSGPLVFLHTNQEPRTAYVSRLNDEATNYRAQELLYTYTVIAAHPIAAVEEVQLDGVALSDEKFVGVARVDWGLGSADQQADPMLVAETDGQWTTAHRGRERAYLAGVFRFDQEAFSSGIPSQSAVVRGALVYDPRTGRTEYSNNAALVVAWYLMWKRGIRATIDEIDIPTLIASANICDELVPLKGGGTERRYTCNGTFDLDQARGAVLEAMLSNMAGTAVFSGGKWYVHAGAWSPSVATITQDNLRGPVTVQANRSARDLFNGVRATYVRPDASWQPTDAPPRLSASALAQDGGEESYTDLDLSFTTSGYAAQRLMQIALRKNRKQRRVSMQLNMYGLILRAQDIVTLSLPRMPLETYRVVEWTLAPDGVDVTLEQEDAEVWAWNAATDELDLGTVSGAATPNGVSLSRPSLTITTPSAAVPTTIAGVVGTVVGATGYEAQWRGVSSSVWNNLTFTHPNFTASTADVATFRARAIAGPSVSNWVTASLPDRPSEVSGVGNGTTITLTIVMPSGVDRAQVFVHTSNDYAAATKQGTEPAFATPSASLVITPGDGADRWIWVRCVSPLGNAGLALGPLVVNRDSATVTITAAAQGGDGIDTGGEGDASGGSQAGGEADPGAGVDGGGSDPGNL